MTGLRFVVLFCIFLIQRAASQSCNCQSEIYISIDDLMKALNNGPGIQNFIEPSQNQGCGYQPSFQPCQQNQCDCQPQQTQQCSCQPQQTQQCSCQPQQRTTFALGQPTFSISGVSLGNQCGQPSQSNQQCGQNQQSLTISKPSISFQPISSQLQQSKAQPQPIKESTSCIVPAALLQAPPYGIIFAGDNLLIDGAVQVCGSMPFNSIIELGGAVPTSGSGCVQYSCGDSCSMCS